MRRGLVLALLLGCACNLLTGAGDLEATLDETPCPGCDGGLGDDAQPAGDDAAAADATKDGDDLTPGGFLDGTFGQGGIVKSALLGRAFGVAVAPDGKIYVVGTTGGQLAVVCFTAAGAPDVTFGAVGRLAIPSGSGSGGELPNIVVAAPGAGIAVDSKGRVVVGGTAQSTITSPNPDGGTPITRYERTLYVVRIAGSALDQGFGQGGRYRPTPAVDGEGARAIAIGAGDGALLVGSGPTGSFTVWRLTEGGAPDPAFGTSGRAVIPVPSATPAVAVAIAGSTALAAGGSAGDFAVGALSEKGTASPGFGDGGVAVVAPGPDEDLAWAIATLPDGRILVGGSKSDEGGRTPLFAVARLQQSGALDTSFATGGIASFDFENGGTWKEVREDLRGLVIDSLGRVVVAGSVSEKPQMGPPLYRAALARLTPGGALDGLFGTGGRLSFTDLPQAKLRASTLARASNGSLVVAGDVDGSGEIFVARVVP